MAREEVSEYQLYQDYDEVLDSCCGNVEIAGLSYSTSYALKHTDPIAYRTGFNDWLDNEVQDGIYICENDKYYFNHGE